MVPLEVAAAAVEAVFEAADQNSKLQEVESGFEYC